MEELTRKIEKNSRTSDFQMEISGEEHDFKSHYFNKFTYCEICGNFMWGVFNKQGVKCQRCGMVTHKKCKKHAVNNCKDLEKKQQNDSSSEKWFRASGGHMFNKVHFERFTWCNVCGQFIVGVTKQGVKCTVCHFSSHKKCHAMTNRNCKYPYRLGEETASNSRHEWMIGNNTGDCSLCKLPLKVGLDSVRCLWCKTKVHLSCVDFEEKACSHGEFRNFIIPPYCLTGEEVETEIELNDEEDGEIVTEKVVAKETIAVFDGSRLEGREIFPMICFVNPNSGNLMGVHIMAKLKKYLNPLQVFDISQGGPKKGLTFAKSLGIPFNILVAGGDGTVCWILSEIDKYEFPFKPPVSIIPLGTGNDLARVFGWGPGYTDEKFDELLTKIRRARPVLKDRWAVYIKEEGEEERLDCYFNNYISFGSDAKVCLDFHLKRKEKPEAFNSRTGNKVKYVGITAKNFFKDTDSLPSILKLRIGGEEVEIPKSQQSLIVTNIPSYASGTNIWGKKKGKNFELCGVGDGKLEVCSVEGTIHIGRIKSNLSSSRRIAQTAAFEVDVLKDMAVQIDGEPWIQKTGSRIRVEHFTKDCLYVKSMEEMKYIHNLVDEIYKG